MKTYHFGCANNQAGHYIHAGPNQDDYSKETRDFVANNPWGYAIDGGLCVKHTNQQGLALVHYKDGWSVLSFWDRSVDTRNGSNSNFLAEGSFTFNELVVIAKRDFPNIWRRFKFEIVEQKNTITQ